MTNHHTPIAAILLACGGAVMVVGSAGLDLLGYGSPGLGAVQIGGIAVGLAVLAVAHRLARGPDSRLGIRDAPWILGVLAIVAAAGAIVIGPRPPSPPDRFREFSINERLLELERSVRVPRRASPRCEPAGDLRLRPVALEPVVTGLRKPVHVTTAGDGTRRLFIVEKGGTIRTALDGRLRESPFLDIRDQVVSDDRPPASWEQGLLSVAFPPDYATAGRFYVHYTAVPDGTITVARFRVSDDRDRALPDSEQTILTVQTVGPNHNGGQLAFGPDGYLYISIGDGSGEMWPSGDPAVYGDAAVEFGPDGEPLIPPGSGYGPWDRVRDDPWRQAQNLGTLRGKILRIDVSGDSAYAVPTDNPFAADDDPETRGEIWAYGLRNPWRFSFDGCDGALFAADVGASEYEEVDLIVKGGNYGWSVMEAGHCFVPPWRPQHCDTAGLVFPIAEYRHLEDNPLGGKAVVGGHVYRGAEMPWLAGRYVFGDFMSARLWALTPSSESSSGWQMDELTTVGVLPTSFGVDADGELLVVDYGGAVHRLVPGTDRPAD